MVTLTLTGDHAREALANTAGDNGDPNMACRVESSHRHGPNAGSGPKPSQLSDTRKGRLALTAVHSGSFICSICLRRSPPTLPLPHDSVPAPCLSPGSSTARLRGKSRVSLTAAVAAEVGNPAHGGLSHPHSVSFASTRWEEACVERSRGRLSPADDVAASNAHFSQTTITSGVSNAVARASSVPNLR